ncbi:hypothetical protein ACH4JS_22410 [Streptomyces sp. NPDC017638]
MTRAPFRVVLRLLVAVRRTAGHGPYDGRLLVGRTTAFAGYGSGSSP